jgi:hypothetical protein
MLLLVFAVVALARVDLYFWNGPLNSVAYQAVGTLNVAGFSSTFSGFGSGNYGHRGWNNNGLYYLGSDIPLASTREYFYNNPPFLTSTRFGTGGLVTGACCASGIFFGITISASRVRVVLCVGISFSRVVFPSVDFAIIVC